MTTDRYLYRITTRGGMERIAPPLPGEGPRPNREFGTEQAALDLARDLNRRSGSPVLNPKHIRATFQVRKIPLRTPPLRWPCCEQAVGRYCVCVESSACPVHGIRCTGSHD